MFAVRRSSRVTTHRLQLIFHRNHRKKNNSAKRIKLRKFYFAFYLLITRLEPIADFRTKNICFFALTKWWPITSYSSAFHFPVYHSQPLPILRTKASHKEHYIYRSRPNAIHLTVIAVAHIQNRVYQSARFVHTIQLKYRNAHVNKI